jgi:acylphosphatase/polyhydroxyalkanoate synthesis regulator phasin
MKRAILHLSGNVQQAGYRARIVAIAKALDIKGYVANLPDSRVKIIAEGNETDLERFIQAVNIKNTLINVTDIEKEYLNPIGEYDSFYKLVEEGETDDRLDTAADFLKELIHVTKNGFDRLENKQDTMIEKQVETMEKIDQSRIEITSEIRSIRDGFRSHFDERITILEHDIAQIKAKIIL